MSLKKILFDIANELHIDVSSTDAISWATSKVNDIAKEVYESRDIVGCLREQTFNVDTDAQTSSMISLPYYVDELRGLRYSTLIGGKVTMNDMRPRYHSGHGWGANAFGMPYRVVRERACYKRDVANASVVTFAMLVAETTDVVIHIVGETTNSGRVSETITIFAGSLSTSTTGNFVGVPENIEKESVNTQDIYVTDVDDVELAVIPNSELKPRYKWLEIADGNASMVPVNQTNSTVDILYKQRFTPYATLYDEFPCGDKADRAIFYAFAAWYEAQKPGSEGRAQGFLQASQQILDDIEMDSDAGRDMDIEFGNNGLLTAQDPRQNTGRYGTTYARNF